MERVTSPIFVQPQSCRAMYSSSRRRLRTLNTPSSPEWARPQTYGRPISTARAPRARALRASVPRQTPPSRYTSQRPATAWTTSGRASMVAGTVSSWRAPWFDTRMPSTPCFTASRASSAVITPLTTIFILVTVLSHSMSSQFRVLSMRLATYLARPPSAVVPLAWEPPLPIKFPMVRCEGSLNWLRRSASRRPRTGVSTVTASAL
mmetsp:Transcript_19966/g.58321  ORF Transcript_19966/g.58321 Transcript_19966/m.58321 type:complete len:206 (+) Transcript_19966:440-1057(+)